METMHKSMEKSEFASVVFRTPTEAYPVDADVKLVFDVTPSLQLNSWDWVGLYKVGWSRQSDYLTYQYITFPDNYQAGKKAQLSIVFPSRTLPKQDGEFYQFCYVSRQVASMCGASGPFQFRSNTAKDFVEEECEDMMVIRPRSDVMREKIQDLDHRLLLATQECESSKHKVEQLEKLITLRDSIITRLQQEVSTLDIDKSQLTVKCDTMEAALDHGEAALHKAQQEKAELEREKEEEQEKVEALRTQIVNLKSCIKHLESQRDELSGQNQSLNDELTTYKEEVLQCQTKVTQSGKTIAKLNESLEQAYNQCSSVVEECEHFKQRDRESSERLLKLARQMDVLKKQKQDAERKHEDLTQELQNANDKLLACGAMKLKLTSDLEAYEVTQQKMSSKFENQESQLRSLQEKYEQSSKHCAELKLKLNDKKGELASANDALAQTESLLNQAMGEVQTRSSSQDHLANKCSDLERELSNATKQLELVKAQLEKVCDEKLAFQEQLLTFESEMKGALVDKSRELTEIMQQLEDKQAQLEDQDRLMAQTETTIQDLHAQVAELTQALEGHASKLSCEEETVTAVRKTVGELEARQWELHQELKEAHKSRDDYAEALRVTEIALEASQDHQQKTKEEEAAKFSLWTANEGLKNRIEAKDLEVQGLKEEVARLEKALRDQSQEREAERQENEELRHRLKLGELEYKAQARQTLQLEHRLQKQASKRGRKTSEEGSSSEMSSSLESEAEGEKHRKYKQLYKQARIEKADLEARLEEKELQLESLQRENQTLATQLQELKLQMEREEKPREREEKPREREEKPSETEEEKEQCDRFMLNYGNPYAKATATADASPQHIFRSTLEEEEEDTMLSGTEEGRELPAPLLPQVLPATGAATDNGSLLERIESVTEEGGPEVFEDCPAMLPDDSFMDALGEGMKICPVCQASIFLPSDFEEHVSTHFGRICPVCRSQADDTMSPGDFEKHVNTCLDSGPAPLLQGETSLD